MPETLIKVDLTQSAYDNDMIHNRWHPDVPMVAWVNPGDDFIVETYDWTGGFIKNNDSADDVRDIDLSIVHFLSGPIGVKGAEPGDLLVVDLLDVGPMKDSLWGFLMPYFETPSLMMSTLMCSQPAISMAPQKVISPSPWLKCRSPIESPPPGT